MEKLISELEALKPCGGEMYAIGMGDMKHKCIAIVKAHTPDSTEARTNIIAKSLRNWLSPEFFSEADIHKMAVGMSKALSEEQSK